ncbi:hypothetical protein N7495_004761 [Penicillium taxi]|uniref:uncharacterized protein n=1 Tax=Penicillium taxi TaxID=168475 RepID=UPI0025450C88|nr:uncharacterized protein N7495_004761 [Penicillium taxi]KAJ5900017.1 hypothetical protein N7495_004761 [Penicillium taxi]
MQNPSCLLYQSEDVRIGDVPLPIIEEDHDVIIRIAYVGISDSDVQLWLDGSAEYLVSEEYPLIMGHEASGIVHAVGPAVQNLQPGDAVTIEPGIACRLCSRCKLGKYNLCPEMRFAGSPPTHGALSKYFKMPADCCYKIPPSVGRPFGLDEACLIEPLAVAVHSVRQIGVQPGDKVIVFGAGTIGLLCAAVAREHGASMITTIDTSRERLDTAHSFVPNGRLAFSSVLMNHALTPSENARCLRGAMDRQSYLSESDVPGYDVAIETSGMESYIQMGIYSLRVGGSFVQTGLGPNVDFPMSAVLENEVNMKGAYKYGPGDFKLALELAFTRKIELQSMIKKVVAFEKFADALELIRKGSLKGKVLIRGAGFTDGIDRDSSEER